jgi:hypothetical protein
MVGKVEDFIAAPRQGHERDQLGLTEFDRTISGEGGVRVSIPRPTRYQLRQIADLLRGYAEECDQLSRRQDLTERQYVLLWRANASILNHKIRDAVDLTGKGKRPKAYPRQLD